MFSWLHFTEIWVPICIALQIGVAHAAWRSGWNQLLWLLLFCSGSSWICFIILLFLFNFRFRLLQFLRWQLNSLTNKGLVLQLVVDILEHLGMRVLLLVNFVSELEIFLVILEHTIFITSNQLNITWSLFIIFDLATFIGFNIKINIGLGESRKHILGSLL